MSGLHLLFVCPNLLAGANIESKSRLLSSTMTGFSFCDSSSNSLSRSVTCSSSSVFCETVLSASEDVSCACKCVQRTHAYLVARFLAHRSFTAATARQAFADRVVQRAAMARISIATKCSMYLALPPLKPRRGLADNPYTYHQP